MRDNTILMKKSVCVTYCWSLWSDFLVWTFSTASDECNVVGSCTSVTSICGLRKAACVSWWHWIALICAFVRLVLRGTGICFCSVLWTVSVRWCGYLYYTCCSPSLLLPAVTALLSLPLRPEFLIHSPYKLLHLLKTCKVMGGHLNIQYHVQFTGHNSLFQRVKNSWSFMGVNMYECPLCTQDGFAVSEWW